MFRRRYLKNKTKPNNYIVYSATAKVTPYTTSGWGANYLSSESTWDSATGIGKLVFDGDITAVPNSGFRNISTLKSILYLPKTIKSIGEAAFRFAESFGIYSALRSVNLNEGIEYIDDRAFLSCRNLASIKIPNSVAALYNFAFNSCTPYTEMSIPGLMSVTFGEQLKYSYSGDHTVGGSGHTGKGMFGLASNLTTINWNAINFPDFSNSENSFFTATSMFDDSTRIPPIRTVNFGSKVKNIPGHLFWKCENILGTIEIPAACTRIGDRAFQACHGITDVVCNAITPPSIEPSDGTSFSSSDGKNAVFRYYDSGWKVMDQIIFHVPVESLDLYKSDTNWSIYADNMKPIVANNDDGYEMIDLGLPSGLLWANKNVGANTSGSSGYFFSWGNIHGYASDTNGNIKGYDFNSTNYDTTKGSTFTGDDLTLPFDSASGQMGNGWRMPTHSELLEMMQNTVHYYIDLSNNVIAGPFEWGTATEDKGLSGTELKSICFVRKNTQFTYGSGSNYIEIPFAGYYEGASVSNVGFGGGIWTTTQADDTKAYRMRVSSDGEIYSDSSSAKLRGRNIRGVISKNNTYQEIDLGLKTTDGKPLLFADRNIGASCPEDTGLYFQWGETTGYNAVEGIVKGNKMFNWEGYKYSDIVGDLLKYNSSDNLSTLQAIDDAAIANMGDGWRMPTAEETAQLLDTSLFTKEYVDLNGNIVTSVTSGNILGIKLTSRISGYEGNSIFIPASGTGGSTNYVKNIRDKYTTGSFWCSNISSTDKTKPYSLYFISSTTYDIIAYERYYGRPVRGVKVGE